MPMNHRLMRPLQTLHPEALDWRNRVVANGGSVSGTTLNAVDRFVKAIVAAGIRDRFFRVNLFCGNSDASLAAVRTPLFRGQSLTGTQFGNATDTNFNFVANDYAETGASGGLTGNGSSKYLQTGVSPANMPVTATGHLAAYAPSAAISGLRYLLGAFNGTTDIYGIRQFTDSVNGFWGAFAAASQTVGATLPGGLWVASRTSSTSCTLLRNGVAIDTNTVSTTPASFSQDIYIFTLNNGATGTATNTLNYALRGYSIGAGMTNAQALAYYSAMQAFQTALGRQV